MTKVILDGAAIRDWAAFHNLCEQAFGFPEFYGRNMNAWVDCLSYLRDDDGMSKFHLTEHEVLQIELLHAEQLRQSAPEILEELEFCIAALNERYEDYGELPALSLLLR
ncbi:barstar family protein [Undibacterium arcticum]|uniref:Barstar family protein n=1 Tax=Undibacterium arcticum TaxID=1762892 RepID=A0ABV7F5K2_9BURK